VYSDEVGQEEMALVIAGTLSGKSELVDLLKGFGAWRNVKSSYGFDTTLNKTCLGG
jgi:hypothetical protein